MAANEETLEAMDKAAELADNDLREIEKSHVIAIANWWKANYMKAGHKRLAKALLKYADKKESY